MKNWISNWLPFLSTGIALAVLIFLIASDPYKSGYRKGYEDAMKRALYLIDSTRKAAVAPANVAAPKDHSIKTEVKDWTYKTREFIGKGAPDGQWGIPFLRQLFVKKVELQGTDSGWYVIVTRERP